MNDIYLYNQNKTAYIRIYSKALEHMVNYKQTGCFSKEAGGELFTNQDMLGNNVHINIACGPDRKDQRRRTSFKQDIESATNTRYSMHEEGCMPIGLWHTHPETSPKPSSRDIKTVRKYFDSLEPTIGQKYVMLILGNNKNEHLFHAQVLSVNDSMKFTFETYY